MVMLHSTLLLVTVAWPEQKNRTQAADLPKLDLENVSRELQAQDEGVCHFQIEDELVKPG